MPTSTMGYNRPYYTDAACTAPLAAAAWSGCYPPVLARSDTSVRGFGCRSTAQLFSTGQRFYGIAYRRTGSTCELVPSDVKLYAVGGEVPLAQLVEGTPTTL